MIVTNFDKAVEKVLVHEGGFVNDPLDRGGATNWGITQKTYENFVGRPVSISEIQNMPRGNAITIYKTQYWDKVRGDEIKSYPIAFSIFDQAVNQGPARAIKRAQSVLGIYPDGNIDSEMIKRLNNSDEADFINKFADESERYYRRIVENNPSQEKFLAGWLKRVESIRSYGMSNLTKASIGIGAVAMIVATTFLYLKLKEKKA